MEAADFRLFLGERLDDTHTGQNVGQLCVHGTAGREALCMELVKLRKDQLDRPYEQRQRNQR